MYDAFDRTASETTSGSSGKTTLFTHLGMEDKVLREEVAGKATKSYQYAPWGQKLTQIKHNTDATKEFSQYLYHPKGDVEAITKDDGNTRATYGYSAYGSDDEKQFTGADKPDAANPEKDQYNDYRYNAHRFDDGSGTGGALDDMSLATDPYTSNRYAFAGGNPISFVELDGHLFGIDISLSDGGHAALDVAGMVPVIGEAADVANGIWYMTEGNYADGLMSMGSAIPFAGNAITAAKYAKKGARAVDAIKSVGKKADDVPKKAPSGGGGGKPKASKSPSKGSKAEGKSGDGGACTKAEAKKNSFVAGTKVLMADGSSKNIEDLTVGETVLAADPETGELQPWVITNTRNHQGLKSLVTLTVDADGPQGKTKPDTITTTARVPFWLPDFGKWVEAHELKPGMWLQTAAGTWAQVTAVSERERTERVYNLSVDGVHTYFVDVGSTDALVHNCGGYMLEAIQAKKRGHELHQQRPYKGGTTAVIGVRNRVTGAIDNRIAINGSGNMPKNWSLNPGESFMKGLYTPRGKPNKHAEQTIFENLGPDEEVIYGGTSRNVCKKICSPFMKENDLRLGGKVENGRDDKTSWRMFWKPTRY
ncbi:polymorphic toxin-type HINT domain-containing protein [Streptomyces sp. NPDC002346]